MTFFPEIQKFSEMHGFNGFSNVPKSKVAHCSDERPKGSIEKRNLTFFSPVSREERETGNSFQQFREGKKNSKRICFREEKKKWIFYAQDSRRERESENNISVFQKRKRNVKCCSLILRREREIESS